VPVRAAITDGTLVDGTTRIALDGETVYRMTTTGAFADAVLVPEAAAMPIPDALPFEQAALLGCAPEELAVQPPFLRAIDAVGSPSTMQAAIAAVHPGGRVVVVGLPSAGARLDLDPTELIAREKTITGSYYGSADPVKSLGRLLDLVRDGSLVLEPLLGSCHPLERIGAAVDEARAAVGGRVILTP
jgi:Zn-dependent alcohol dehydrogenase